MSLFDKVDAIKNKLDSENKNQDSGRILDLDKKKKKLQQALSIINYRMRIRPNLIKEKKLYPLSKKIDIVQRNKQLNDSEKFRLNKDNLDKEKKIEKEIKNSQDIITKTNTDPNKKENIVGYEILKNLGVNIESTYNYRVEGEIKKQLKTIEEEKEILMEKQIENISPDVFSKINHTLDLNKADSFNSLDMSSKIEIVKNIKKECVKDEETISKVIVKGYVEKKIKDTTLNEEQIKEKEKEQEKKGFNYLSKEKIEVLKKRIIEFSGLWEIIKDKPIICNEYHTSKNISGLADLYRKHIRLLENDPAKPYFEISYNAINGLINQNQKNGKDKIVNVDEYLNKYLPDKIQKMKNLIKIYDEKLSDEDKKELRENKYDSQKWGMKMDELFNKDNLKNYRAEVLSDYKDVININHETNLKSTLAVEYVKDNEDCYDENNKFDRDVIRENEIKIKEIKSEGKKIAEKIEKEISKVFVEEELQKDLKYAVKK